MQPLDNDEVQALTAIENGILTGAQLYVQWKAKTNNISPDTKEFQIAVVKLFGEGFDLKKDAKETLIKDMQSKGVKLEEKLPDQLPPNFVRNRGPTDYFKITLPDNSQKFIGITNAAPFILNGPTVSETEQIANPTPVQTVL